jgi:spermidine/putrescine transport system substrate-binding protein
MQDVTGVEEDRRRTWMGRVGIAMLSLVAALGLAACGSDGGLESGEEEGEGGAATETVQLDPPPSGELTISNWPLYIDKAGGAVDGPGSTIDEFSQEFGVDVEYIEDINDNFEFFGKMQPLLDEGESGGRSIFVVTDYMVEIMNDLGYLQTLDKSGLPNIEKNLRADLQHPPFDPDRSISIPWQTFLTGIVVRTDLAPEIDSVEDLFDPKYEGKVTFIGDMYDDVPLVMKMQGVDPADATEEDWMTAIDTIGEAADSGQIRDFTGNAYAGPIAKGDLVAALGWSGDAIQLQADNPNIEWIPPAEGCNISTDNMVIPVGAPNPTAAEAFMNYVYEPEVQADIASFVQFVPPVDGTQDVLADSDPDLAKNELIFPDQEFTAACSVNPAPDASFREEITEAYQTVVTGGGG